MHSDQREKNGEVGAVAHHNAEQSLVSNIPPIAFVYLCHFLCFDADRDKHASWRGKLIQKGGRYLISGGTDMNSVKRRWFDRSDT